MKWTRLIQIKRWTLLTQAGLEISNLKDTLYRVDANSYLIAVPYDEGLQTHGDLRFVTSVLWAESEGAARRASLMEIENDQIDRSAVPPQEMLLPDAANRYGDIL